MALQQIASKEVMVLTQNFLPSLLLAAVEVVQAQRKMVLMVVQVAVRRQMAALAGLWDWVTPP
jgi:hypothetical protein